MTTLGDFLRDLSRIELSGSAFGNSGAGSIQGARLAATVALINDGLLHLHSALMLKEGSVIVEMKGNTTHYELDSRFAESRYDPLQVAYPYIKDSIGQPFADDVLKIVEVTGQDGRNWPINASGHARAVFVTQGVNVLQIPQPLDAVAIAVRYRAAHAPLREDAPDAPLQLPRTLHAPLRAFVAAGLYRAMPVESGQQQAALYEARYAQAVAEVAASDALSSSHIRASCRFCANGWV